MDLLFLSKRILLGTNSCDDNKLIHGGIIVDTEGIIRRVLQTPQEVNTYLYNNESEAVYDFGDLVLMPGLIDANVHINEPGRKDWEGFAAATKAAAAGGFTTIIDRPINSTPATTSVTALKAKMATARGKISVDVGFWGGFVPDNLEQLKPLLAAGVIGLQCTLCPSAAPVEAEFKPVNEQELQTALKQLDENTVLAFHAELPQCIPPPFTSNLDAAKQYETFLKTRPAEMEIEAIKLIGKLAKENKSVHYHIMNVSAAEALPHIANIQRNSGAKLSAETCPHYLTLAAEQVEDCQTQFKTHPPIRSSENQKPLWQALQHDGSLNMITTDHSPATPGVKCQTYGKGRGNFLTAWPGISSLQLGLSAVWTQCQTHGLQINDIHRLMCRNPALLCGIEAFKGRIAVGYDADFCIWSPEEEFSVTPDDLFSTNKTTPYMDQRLRGVVHATVVRGLHVFQKNEGFGQPLGKILLRKSSKKVVKTVRI